MWIRNLRTTCCSQFVSNAYSEAQASEVSTIFEILKSRKMVSVYYSRYDYREADCEARRRVGNTGKDD